MALGGVLDPKKRADPQHFVCQVFAVFEPRDEISDDTSDSTLDIK